MKERVTLTIDRDVLSMVDDRIDGVSIKNRSHAIEMFVRQSLQSDALEMAVILAGGSSSETERIFTKVEGKNLLQHNIDLCVRHGIRKIFLLVGESESRIREYLSSVQQIVSVEVIKEAEPLGTAGALKLIEDSLQGTFVVMNSAELKDVNLKKMFQSHVSHKSKGTIALTTATDPSEFGVALMDGTRIVNFVQKPNKDAAQSNLISAGVYILEPDVLDLIPRGYATFETDVFPKISKSLELHGYIFSGQWVRVAGGSSVTDWKGFRA
jgi:NDP-sugar pyrophosphorylase family protein